MSDIKETVRKSYGKIALQPPDKGPTCCGTAKRTNSQYGPEKIGELDIADLGLGCGNPAAFSEFKEGMTVLDLGSGAGIDAFIASKQVGSSGKVIGLDMTEEMIQRARSNATKLNITNVEFRLGEIEQMPIESGSVDRILSNCVINLVPDKARAFGEMYRVLKPGGAFIISDMVTSGTMPASLKNDPELWCGCVAGALDKSAYLGIIRQAGFHDVQVIQEKKYDHRSTSTFGLYSITVKATK